MTDELRNFLELSFQNSKAKEFFVGVADPKLGASISEGTKIVCRSNEFIQELLRGVRFHFERFIKDLKVVIYCILLHCVILSFAGFHYNTFCIAWGFGESSIGSRTQLQ